MKSIKLPTDLVRMAHILADNAPLYLVGGAVRDAIMERESDDLDIAGKWQVDELKSLLSGKGYIFSGEYPRTGTVIVKGNGFDAEYTTFRKDSYPIGSGEHAPARVEFTNDICEDAMRRDFSCNAIYYDIVGGSYIDPTGGIEAIGRRLLITTRSPQTVLAEDALRILRLVRFATELGANIDSESYLVAKEYADRLADISTERLRTELVKILSVRSSKRAYSDARLPSYGLAMLNDMQLLKRFYGANFSTECILAMDNLKEQGSSRYAMTLEQHLALMYLSSGVESAERALRGLKFSNKIIDDTLAVMHGLDELTQIVDSGGGDYSNMKQYVMRNYRHINDICALIIALGQQCGELFEALTVIESVGLPTSINQLKIGGKELLVLEAKPSNIGTILKKTLEYAIDREITDKRGQLAIATELLWRESE